MTRVVVAAAVIERDGRLLVTRRRAGTHLEGLWEFPGGKREPHEALADCLVRELHEELGAGALVGDLVFMTTHTYLDRVVELHFFRCELTSEPSALLGQELRWVERRDLASLEFPPADAELIRRLSDGAPG